jgi:hypothetical protein
MYNIFVNKWFKFLLLPGSPASKVLRRRYQYIKSRRTVAFSVMPAVICSSKRN